MITPGPQRRKRVKHGRVPAQRRARDGENMVFMVGIGIREIAAPVCLVSEAVVTLTLPILGRAAGFPRRFQMSFFLTRWARQNLLPGSSPRPAETSVVVQMRLEFFETRVSCPGQGSGPGTHGNRVASLAQHVDRHGEVEAEQLPIRAHLARQRPVAA